MAEFEVGETLGVSTSVDENDTCYESSDVYIVVHDLDATFVGKSYVDSEVIFLTSSDPIDNISPDPLDAFHVSYSCSLPS